MNPLPLTDCPSRRPGQVFPKPIDGLFIAYNSAKNPTGGNVAGRSDYAINAGDNGGNRRTITTSIVGDSLFPEVGQRSRQNYNSATTFNWPTSELGWTIPTGGNPRVITVYGHQFSAQ